MKADSFSHPLYSYKMRVSDGIKINMIGRASGGLKGGVVSFIVCFMDREEESGFINRFINGESLGGPVNGQVGGSEPRGSKNDIVFEGHDVEDVFEGDSFNEEITGIANVSFCVKGSIGISGANGNSKFCNRKVVLFDKIIVDAGDVCTTINEGIGINDFQGM